MALVLSLISIVLLGLKEGIGLPLEYRESDAAINRRKEIDDSLRAEVKTNMSRVMVILSEHKEKEEKELEEIEELGHCAFLARSTSIRILEGMTDSMSRALRTFGTGILVVVVVVSYFLYLSISATIVSNESIFFAILYAIVTAIPFIMTYNRVKKHYILREAFTRLSENANLEYCKKLVGKLQDKDVL
jgi:uncharacterized protein YjeT (DUF2065 family)